MKDKKPDPAPEQNRRGEVIPPTEKEFKGFVRKLLAVKNPPVEPTQKRTK